MSVLVITGRLNRDVEIRSTQKGTAVAQFDLPDDVGYGEKKATNWIRCTIFGTRAEKLAPYLTKGTMVEVCGQPNIETWQSKDGTTKAKLSVTVNDVRLHGGGKKDEPVADNARATSDLDDEMPF